MNEELPTTRKILEFVSVLQYKDIPPEAVHETKRLLLDAMGCALGGLLVKKGKLGVKMALRLGGIGESSIWGTSDKVSAAGAAFATGELINALDMDGIIFPAGHVSPCVIPAPVALTEYSDSTGKELITAIAMAHELAIRVSEAMSYWREIVREGPERGSVKWPEVSGLGASIAAGVLACGKVLKLDAEKLGHAMGIAVHFCPVPSMSKWENTIPSAMTKYLDMGWISQAEVQAALLAEMGYTGDASILEGPSGFWRMSGSKKWEPEKITDRLGVKWLFSRRAIYKPYPCCRGMHGGLDCFIYLLEKYNLKPGEIEKVLCLTDPIVDRHLFRSREIVTHVDAQFNTAYPFAVAAYRLKPGPAWQSKEAMGNSEILSFMKKVSVSIYPGYGEIYLKDPRSPVTRVEVTARGRTFTEERNWMKGNPYPEQARMSDEDLIEKFRNNASGALPPRKIALAAEAIMHLEKLESVRELIGNLSP